MKAALIIPLLITPMFIAQVSHAVPYITPERCAHDSLAQGAAPVAGSAAGRNAWFKVCKPEAYDTTFPDGNENDPVTHSRMVYPTYGIVTGRDANNQTTFTTNGYRAPSVAPATEADPSCIVPAPNKFVGICTSGCVAPASEIATAKGRVSILDMSTAPGVSEVLVPMANAAGVVQLEKNAVKNFTKDMIATQQTVYVIKTVSGGEIYASENHPFLSGSHKMVRAVDLKVGDSLVTSEGRKDLITQVSTQPYFGKLYNLTVDTNEREKSLYVVEGYISGDKKIQDESVSEFNRAVLRDLATEGIN